MVRTAPAPEVLTAAAYIPGVSTLVARLVQRDGLNHHGERYFAHAGGAALARRVAAERLRADALRGLPRALAEIRQLLRPVPGESRPGVAACPWCRGQLTAREGAVALGGRRLHEGCAAAFTVVMAEG